MKCNRALHERLFTLTRAMRETPGGEVACCGSFQPKFVASLPQDPTLLTDRETKAFLRILKAVSGGAKSVLRASAELQLGLSGINWRQPAITHYFKPALKMVKTKVSRSWVDRPISSTDLSPKRKGKSDNTFFLTKNRNLTVFNVFDSIVHDDDTVYWEFKAG